MLKFTFQWPTRTNNLDIAQPEYLYDPERYAELLFYLNPAHRNPHHDGVPVPFGLKGVSLAVCALVIIKLWNMADVGLCDCICQIGFVYIEDEDICAMSISLDSLGKIMQSNELFHLRKCQFSFIPPPPYCNYLLLKNSPLAMSLAQSLPNKVGPWLPKPQWNSPWEDYHHRCRRLVRQREHSRECRCVWPVSWCVQIMTCLS